MELDEAFLKAAKAFYAGNSHKNVDKYSKRPFDYSLSKLDEMKKKFSRNSTPEEEMPEDPEVELEDDIETKLEDGEE